MPDRACPALDTGSGMTGCGYLVTGLITGRAMYEHGFILNSHLQCTQTSFRGQSTGVFLIFVIYFSACCSWCRQIYKPPSRLAENRSRPMAWNPPSTQNLFLILSAGDLYILTNSGAFQAIAIIVYLAEFKLFFFIGHHLLVRIPHSNNTLDVQVVRQVEQFCDIVS